MTRVPRNLLRAVFRSATQLRVATMVVVVVVLALGCVRARRSDGGGKEVPLADGGVQPTVSGAPRLTLLVPDSAQVPMRSLVEVVVRGSGFSPGPSGANDVVLGPFRAYRVPANDAGTELRFIVPDRLPDPPASGPRPLLPGNYSLTVSTAAGTSNALSFRVIP